MGNGIDRLQLPRPLLLQRVQARVLQGDRRLRGKQGEQIDGFRIEVVEVIALAIKHADYFVTHHQGNCKLGASRFGGAEIARIFGDVGRVDRLFLLRRSPSDSVPYRQAVRILAFVPANLRADEQLLRLLVEQHNGHVSQMKIVVCDLQDALQHLVQIKGGEHGLAGIVQDRNFIHTSGDIVT